MTRGKATEIANSFLNEMNPELWNGIGDAPDRFNDYPWQCKLSDDINLEITFVYEEEDGWCHFCDLTYARDNSSFKTLSGYGIDSELNLIDTIMDICIDSGL